MRLRHSTTAQDDASEAVASTFIQQTTSSEESGIATPKSSRELDEFIKEYKELRKVYHKRALWGEKWAHGQVAWRDD